MSGVQKVFQRVFVARFYQVNTGFFLFWILLFVGFIEPIVTIRFHYALMVRMTFEMPLLLAACGVWTLYYIKCVAYILRAMAEPQNSFVYEAQALPERPLKTQLAYVLTAIFAPMLLYVGITVGVAISGHRYVALAIILLYQTAVFVVSVIICVSPVINAARPTKVAAIVSLLSRLRPRTIHLHALLLTYLLQQKKLLILLLKAGSLILLQLMVALNKDTLHLEGTYFFLLLIITGHALLPYYFVRFTEAQSWLRNLPLSLPKRYGYFALTYALLFLPELAFLLVHTHTSLSIASILSIYTLAVTMLCAMHTLLYMRGTGVERYTLILVCMLPVVMILLPAISIWWLAGFWLMSSFLLFPILYRRYEIIME